MIDIQKKQAGRVVDLKRMREPENREEIKPEKKRGGLFIFGGGLFFKKEKKHRVDFLHHYKNIEKKEEFIEQEAFREYLDAITEEKKQNTLLKYYNFITRALKLWWLPLFIIRFIWLLFWKLFKITFLPKRKKKVEWAKVAAAVKKTENKGSKKIDLRKNSQPEKIAASARYEEPEENAFSVFWQAIWSLPREIKNLLLGRTTEDYFYQRVLLDEMNRKKFHPFRHLLTFGLLLVLFVVPLAALSFFNGAGIGDLRGRVLGATDSAVNNLQAAAADAVGLNLKQASDNFSAAQESFAQANTDLSAVSGLIFTIGKIIPNDQIKLAAESREIISAGSSAASLGNNLSLGISALLEKNDKPLTDKINDFIQYEILAEADAKNLNDEVAKINVNVLPANYRDQFISLKQKSSDLDLILSKNIDLIQKLNLFLGEKMDKRYLLVFEDNAEMRASGGFVGSYALLDLGQGKIKNIEAPQGGSYDTKGAMNAYIIPPQPMTLINPRWYFWDSNWWPDWEKSAQKMEWFYENSGGPTTDGIIAFTPTVLQRLLAITGPIDMTDVNGMTMTSDNLWTNMRAAIETEKTADAKLPYDLAENKPKKVIGQLMQKLMAQIPERLDRDKFMAILSSIQQDLNEKQILIYLQDSDLQSEVEARNWAGKIKDTDKDYLEVVDTNIAGGKSDRFMTENIDQRAEVQADGTIIDTVKITRANTASSTALFAGERNVDWMRIYVPAGSQLLAATGFNAPNSIYFTAPDASRGVVDSDVAAEEGNNAVVDAANASTTIYSDSGKTVFANWSMVDPGQSVTLILKYQLPFKLVNSPSPIATSTGLQGIIDKYVQSQNKNLMVYSLLAQKQPGAVATTINSALSLSDNFKIDWSYPLDLISGVSGWQTSGSLDADKYWAAVIE
jgi:hypothetical protein